MMLDVALVQTIDRRRVRRSRWSWERRERVGMRPDRPQRPASPGRTVTTRLADLAFEGDDEAASIDEALERLWVTSGGLVHRSHCRLRHNSIAPWGQHNCGWFDRACRVCVPEGLPGWYVK